MNDSEEIKKLLKNIALSKSTNTEPMNVSETIKELSKHLKNIASVDTNKPIPFFVNSKGEHISLITTDSEDKQEKIIELKDTKTKKIYHKWFALYYWMELNSNGQRPPINLEGNFIKTEIEAIGFEILLKYGIECKNGQNFYREFKEIDVNNEKLIQNNFGKEWKEMIFKICNNDKRIVDYINLKYPNKNKGITR